MTPDREGARAGSPPWIDRVLVSLARFGSRNPWVVVLVTLALLGVSAAFISKLEVRGDFIELLPSESEGAKLFRRSLARMGGGSATMFVIVDSPDPDANKRIVDALEPRLRELPRSLVRTVEHGPEEARRFYMARRWLFAEVGDLEEVECELARAQSQAVPGFVDLDDDVPCATRRSDHGQRRPATTTAAHADPAPAPPTGHGPFAMFRDRLERQAREVDQFPTGYFRNPEGTLFAIVMRSPGTGTGDASGDRLMARVRAIIDGVNVRSFHPRAQVGLGGDIPNASAERDALVEDAAMSTGLAILLILAVISIFFRSVASLAHIGLSMVVGVAAAYTVAYFAFGYLNMSTTFLGSIIAGNGINYGILYLARYRERRAAGDDREAALVDAAVTCRAGTQLAAFAAAGAYGSLMLTSFRGFSQFGLIGAVGMVFCWCATMATVPATVTLWERLVTRFPRMRERVEHPTLRTPIADFVGRTTSRFAIPITVVGLVLTVIAVSVLPRYLRDPWEYNFANLGSRGSRHTGADAWSSRADRIFTARGGSADMLLADSFDDVLPLADALRARDRARTGGTYIDRIETAWDRLGGTPPVVARKLELLNEIRAHIDALTPSLAGEDLETARTWRPPNDLHPPRPDELPALVREQFTEKNGRFGTPVFVYYTPIYTPSDGRKLMIVADLTQNVRLADGRVVPTVSRATVFAEMVRAMGRDGPRATLAAFLAVVTVVVLATRRLRPALAVLGSLVCAVALTVGGAAELGVRLNFLNFVALPLTFGIGVEYAMNVYDRTRVLGGDTAAALRSVGGAVTLCSMTTIIGYGALLVADNQALQSFGRYAMAGELACIITAMVLLPATLRWVRR